MHSMPQSEDVFSILPPFPAQIPDAVLRSMVLPEPYLCEFEGGSPKSRFNYCGGTQGCKSIC